MCSRLPVCTNSYECVCSFLFLLLVAGSTVVHICALRQCGALWFPAPRLLIFFFLLSFIVLYSLSHSLPLPSSPFYQPSFVYSIEDVWLNILRPAESSWFSNFSCPLCQRKTKACAKYIWKRSLNLSELTLYFPSFLVSITPPSSSLSLSLFFFVFTNTTSQVRIEGSVKLWSWNILFLFCFCFVVSASGQCQGPHITVRECQPAMQQVQEPAGEHHALRDHTRVSAANQRSGRIWLHQRQLHWWIQVRKKLPELLFSMFSFQHLVLASVTVYRPYF